MINKEIIDAISTYEMAIADLTGHNPNVFYELAIRHMEMRPVVHIAATNTPIPFDNLGHKVIFFNVNDWNSHVNAREEIAEVVRQRMEPDYKVSNPITQGRGELILARSANSKDQLIANMVATLDCRTGQVEHLTARDDAQTATLANFRSDLRVRGLAGLGAFSRPETTIAAGRSYMFEPVLPAVLDSSGLTLETGKLSVNTPSVANKPEKKG